MVNMQPGDGSSSSGLQLIPKNLDSNTVGSSAHKLVNHIQILSYGSTSPVCSCKEFFLV